MHFLTQIKFHSKVGNLYRRFYLSHDLLLSIIDVR